MNTANTNMSNRETDSAPPSVPAITARIGKVWSLKEILGN